MKIIEKRKATLEELKQFKKGHEDVKWLVEHSEELSEKYREKYIAIAGEEAFIGATKDEAIYKARSKYPDRTPLVQHIPYTKRIKVLL